MPATTTDRYTVRRKVLQIFGASFHIYDSEDRIVGFCRQKAFKLREDLRLYTDESCSKELFRIRARQIIDIGVTFDVTLPDGSSLGSLRRKGLKSLVRDEWLILSPEGQEIGLIQEDSGSLAMLRRLIEVAALLFPQSFTVTTAAGDLVATLRTHFNLFVRRIGIAVHADHPEIDDLILLAIGCLIAAIESRDQSW